MMKKSNFNMKFGASSERAHHILHEYLGTRKLTASWIRHLLTIDQNSSAITITKLLDLCLQTR